MKEKLGTRKVVYNDNSDIAISVKDLHKSFKLPTEHAGGLKQAIFNRLRGIKGYTEQKVLRGLDFEIKKVISLVLSVATVAVNLHYLRFLPASITQVRAKSPLMARLFHSSSLALASIQN